MFGKLFGLFLQPSQVNDLLNPALLGNLQKILRRQFVLLVKLLLLIPHTVYQVISRVHALHDRPEFLFLQTVRVNGFESGMSQDGGTSPVAKHAADTVSAINQFRDQPMGNIPVGTGD